MKNVKTVKKCIWNPAREDAGAMFVSRFFWAKGSLLFGGPVPQKIWGRLPGWLVWWWGHGHMDWFENRVPSKWLLHVETWFPNSSSVFFWFRFSTYLICGWCIFIILYYIFWPKYQHISASTVPTYWFSMVYGSKSRELSTYWTRTKMSTYVHIFTYFSHFSPFLSIVQSHFFKHAFLKYMLVTFFWNIFHISNDSLL